MTSLLPPDFFQQLLQQIQDQATIFATEMVKMITGMIWSLLRPYWSYLVVSFSLLLIIATIKAMLGQWGVLRSLLYHLFYFGILGIFIAIKGWGILFNPLFDLIAWIVYRVSYKLTGLILGKG